MKKRIWNRQQWNLIKSLKRVCVATMSSVSTMEFGEVPLEWEWSERWRSLVPGQVVDTRDGCSRPPRVAFGHSLAIFWAWARQALRHYPKPRLPCLPAASFAVVLPSSWQLCMTSCPKPILPLQSLCWRLSLHSFTTYHNRRLQA